MLPKIIKNLQKAPRKYALNKSKRIKKLKQRISDSQVHFCHTYQSVFSGYKYHWCWLFERIFVPQSICLFYHISLKLCKFSEFFINFLFWVWYPESMRTHCLNIQLGVGVVLCYWVYTQLPSIVTTCNLANCLCTMLCMRC